VEKVFLINNYNKMEHITMVSQILLLLLPLVFIFIIITLVNKIVKIFISLGKKVVFKALNECLTYLKKIS